MLSFGKKIVFVGVIFSIVTMFVLHESFIVKQTLNKDSTKAKKEYAFYESPQKIFNRQGIAIPQIKYKAPRTRDGINDGNSEDFSVARIDIINKESKLYKQYYQAYSKAPFKIAVMDGRLVGVYKKYDSVDFITTDYQFVINTLDDTALAHQQILNEFTANDTFGLWNDSLANNLRAAIQDYNVEDVFSISSINCKQLRCVATLSFDNSNERKMNSFFSKLNQDANYHFYAIPTYNMSAFEATLLIIRI